jgi:hypothetical protein
MKKEEQKIKFDMSILSLNELIEVYEEIKEFIALLEKKKIVPEGGETKNE